MAAAGQCGVGYGEVRSGINCELRNFAGLGNIESKFHVLSFGRTDVRLRNFSSQILLCDLMPLLAGGGQFRVRRADRDRASGAFVQERNDIEILDL